MGTLSEVLEKEQVWGCFESDRAALYDQYQHVPYDAATGQTPDALRSAIFGYLRNHSAEPHITQKAHVFRYLLTHAQIHVDAFDWLPDKLNHGNLLHLLRERWRQGARRGPLAQAGAWFDLIDATDAAKGGLDTGHISPGWTKMFSSGLLGLAAEARERRSCCPDADQGQRAFYDAVETVCQEAIVLSHRFAEQAEAMASAHPEHQRRLGMIAETCRRTPAHPPRTLHEALHFHWLMHELIELEGEAVRSLGRFDQIFHPYYLADLASGRLDREQAKELFKGYFMKSYARTRGAGNGAHFALGGQLPDGSDAVNKLTYLVLEAYEELNAPDPKLSVRFFSGTETACYRRVLDLIRRGHNAIVLMNDDIVVPALQKRGKALEDARCYIAIGCYEPAVDGKEAACTTNLQVNLAKAMELALHDGVDPLSGTRLGPRTGDPRGLLGFDAFLAAYLAQLDHLFERSAAAIAGHERLWSQINPSPLVACTIDDCLARGRDVGEGGCHYNSVGCIGVGLANAVDSLLAIKRAVYQAERYTMDEIIAALGRDWAQDEPMRQYLINAVPKWGNGDAEADELGQLVASHYCATVHAHTNERGGPYQAALYSFTFQWELGRDTGALPDGKRAHEALAPGVGAMAGRDRAGIMALLESVAKLDFTETPDGSVLDLRLHPSSVAGMAGLDAMVSLVRAFFARGGFAVQFNVLDGDALLAAQREPEAYATLQVRVAGYSDYFVNLSREVQDHLIDMHSHAI